MSVIFRSNHEWTLTRLGKSHQVNFVQTGTQFGGNYFGIDDSSTFLGEILTGQGRTLVQFVQSRQPNGYHAVHAGKLVRAGRIEGHWYDTAGSAGHFSLKCQHDVADAIENAKERAIASRKPPAPLEPPTPPVSTLTATALATRLAEIHRLVAKADYPQALRRLDQLHRQAPEASQVFSLLSQIFIEKGIGYPAMAANHQALCLNPLDDLAKVNSLRISQFSPSDLSRTHPQRDDNYSVLTDQYPALFSALSYGDMMPLAGAAPMDSSAYRNQRSPYKSLIATAYHQAVPPLMGTKPYIRPPNPQPVTVPVPVPVARRPSRLQRWLQRIKQWFRSIGKKLFTFMK